MKTKHEIMTELIEKADVIIDESWSMYKVGSDEWRIYHSHLDEYTRLRAELAEAKDGSADLPPQEILGSCLRTTGDDVYTAIWGPHGWSKEHSEIVDRIVKAMHQFASQIQRMPTEGLTWPSIDDAQIELYNIMQKNKIFEEPEYVSYRTLEMLMEWYRSQLNK